MIQYSKVGNLFTLDEDYVEDGIYIPKCFTWNGASIPVWLHWLIKPTEKTKEASLVHDMFYGAGNGVARKLADDIFRVKLLEDNVKPMKAWVMWVAVRLFGWLYFKY